MRYGVWVTSHLRTAMGMRWLSTLYVLCTVFIAFLIVFDKDH